MPVFIHCLYVGRLQGLQRCGVARRLAYTHFLLYFLYAICHGASVHCSVVRLVSSGSACIRALASTCGCVPCAHAVPYSGTVVDFMHKFSCKAWCYVVCWAIAGAQKAHGYARVSRGRSPCTMPGRCFSCCFLCLPGYLVRFNVTIAVWAGGFVAVPIQPDPNIAGFGESCLNYCLRSAIFRASRLWREIVMVVYWNWTSSRFVFSQFAQARSSAPSVVMACRTAGSKFVWLLGSVWLTFGGWMDLLDVDKKGFRRVDEAPNSCPRRPCSTLTGGCQHELLGCVLGSAYCVRCDHNGWIEGLAPGIAVPCL